MFLNQKKQTCPKAPPWPKPKKHGHQQVSHPPTSTAKKILPTPKRPTQTAQAPAKAPCDPAYCPGAGCWCQPPAPPPERPHLDVETPPWRIGCSWSPGAVDVIKSLTVHGLPSFHPSSFSGPPLWSVSSGPGQQATRLRLTSGNWKSSIANYKTPAHIMFYDCNPFPTFNRCIVLLASLSVVHLDLLGTSCI